MTNKRKVAVILILLVSIVFYYFAAYGLEKDKQYAQYLPALREIYPLAYDKLELLRMGELKKKQCIVRKTDVSSEIQVEHFGENGATSQLSDNFFNLPQEEIDAIQYLMTNPALPLHCTYLNYGTNSWYQGVSYNGGDFFHEVGGGVIMGIYYFEDEPPKEVRRDDNYVEHLGEHYWIVIFRLQRP